MSEINEDVPNEAADDIASKLIEILVNKFKEKVFILFVLFCFNLILILNDFIYQTGAAPNEEELNNLLSELTEERIANMLEGKDEDKENENQEEVGEGEDESEEDVLEDEEGEEDESEESEGKEENENEKENEKEESSENSSKRNLDNNEEEEEEGNNDDITSKKPRTEEVSS